MGKILKKTKYIVFIIIIILSILFFTCKNLKKQNILSLNKNYLTKDYNFQIELKNDITNLVDHLKKVYGGNEKYLLNNKILDQVGSEYGDWFAFSAARFGLEDNFDEYIALLKNYVITNYNNINQITPLTRIIITYATLGCDPKNFDENINLLSKLYNKKEINNLNDLAYMLIAFDSKNYIIPSESTYTRETIINSILKKQKQDGGFAWDSTTSSDADITALVLQALAPYYIKNKKLQNDDVSQKILQDVRNSVDLAISFLSSKMSKNGDVMGWGEEANACTTAQVLIATCLINKFNDSLFIKNNKNLLDGLLRYRTNVGGFKNYLNDTKEDSLTNSEALMALVTCYRIEIEKKDSIFNLSDIIKKENIVFSDFAKGQITNYKEFLKENKITTEYKNEIYNLLIYINYSKDFDKNDLYKQYLGEIKAKIDEIQQEIDGINLDIQKLNPRYNKINLSKEKLIKSIKQRYNKLSLYDKTKIQDYEFVSSAETKINLEKRSVFIYAIVGIFALVLVACLTIKLIKKYREKS